jgi:TPR repeat protein
LVKRIFELPILVVILVLACLTATQAQQSDAPKVEGNAAADLDQLRDRFKKGDAAAQYELAERHRLGHSGEQHYAKAIELYNSSADQGFAASQFRLGELYEEGEFLERDLGKAVELYQKAAEQGHLGAQYALAHIYHLGSGVERDMDAAMVWYHQAALRGNEWSQLALGDQYRIGLAVPRDLVQSTNWYRMAAEQGNNFAQYELGYAYRFGNGVERNISQALEWYRLSAEAGNPSAKLVLAELEAVDTATVISTAPVPQVSKNSDSEVLVSVSEAGLAFSASAMRTVAEEKAALQPPESEETLQIASSAPESDAAAPGTELAYAAEPTYSDEAEVSLLLAHAQDQVARLALTTPEGDNAYETYQLILSFQPNNEATLDGIEQIGVKYVELANLAAAKGNLRKANRYAAKAAILAPEHPLVLPMTIPMEADQPTTEETTPVPEILSDFKTPPSAPEQRQEVTAKVEVATATDASTTLQDLVQDADDLVFEPHNYQDRQVVVTGSVVHLLWDYRLKAETGQNSIVIDIDGLSQADRAKLDAAIEKVGFLGQVRARIRGRIERQTLATFKLTATELALNEIDPSADNTLSPDLGPGLAETAPLVVILYPGEPFGEINVNNNRNRSGDRGRASANGANSNGGGASGGGSGSSSSGGSGNGNSGNGNSGKGN